MAGVLGAAALLAGLSAHGAAEEIARTQCAACHGEGGNSVVAAFPKLAGQQSDYLAKQLTEFLAGKRKSDVMAPALASIKADDVAGLATYFATQKAAPGQIEDPTLLPAGKKLYEDGNDANGVPACAGCHMEKGEGNERNPRVAGQHQAYAVQQMMDFKSGVRSNDKGRVMRVVAQRLSESEIRSVAEYLAVLP